MISPAGTVRCVLRHRDRARPTGRRIVKSRHSRAADEPGKLDRVGMPGNTDREGVRPCRPDAAAPLPPVLVVTVRAARTRGPVASGTHGPGVSGTRWPVAAALSRSAATWTRGPVASGPLATIGG